MDCGIFGIVGKKPQRRNFKIHRGLGTVDQAFNKEFLDEMGEMGWKIFFALKGLQHRGQDSSGMVISDNIGGGHNRYSTTGEINKENIQPIEGNFYGAPFALAQNGNLINTLELKKEAEGRGADFGKNCQLDSAAELEISDTRVIVKLIETSPFHDFFDALREVLLKMIGAFSLVVFYRDKVIGVKDPFGIRPLCLGESADYYAISSESCAIDHLSIQLKREINPAEFIVIDSNGISSVNWTAPLKKKICLFEYIYFARPDSVIEGVPVYRARKKMGQYLAYEHRLRLILGEAIVPVLDSGLMAALGVHEATNIPLAYEALFRAHFSFGRSFISGPDLRQLGVSLKFNPVLFDIQGKRVVMVDDSIVRGTTTPKVINFLKKPKELMGMTIGGAKAIDILISSPPCRFSCYYGIDTWRVKGELIAANCQGDILNIKDQIGADYLGYLSLENTIRAVVESDLTRKLCFDDFCTACFTGNYPILN